MGSSSAVHFGQLFDEGGLVQLVNQHGHVPITDDNKLLMVAHAAGTRMHAWNVAREWFERGLSPQPKVFAWNGRPVAEFCRDPAKAIATITENPRELLILTDVHGVPLMVLQAYLPNVTGDVLAMIHGLQQALGSVAGETIATLLADLT